MLVSILLLLEACHPSAAEVAKMESRLAQLEAQQEEMRSQIIAMEGEQRAMQVQSDTASIERRRARSLSEDLSARVTELEAAKAPAVAAKQPGRPDPGARYAATVGDAHTRGSNDALVTIVVFSDFQCPFCARVTPTLEKVEQAYGQDVRVVYKHNPLAFHHYALPAAKAAEAAGRQGKFWKMHDLLFENQRELADEDLRRYAKTLRLDRKRFARDLRAQDIAQKIEAHQTQANALGARGTPAFFINGRFLSGAQPFESFATLIDAELAHARGMVESGTPRGEVYDTLMRTALPAVQ